MSIGCYVSFSHAEGCFSLKLRSAKSVFRLCHAGLKYENTIERFWSLL
jgi:hypothetical protein